MEALKRNGQTYADNLVDSVLTFDDSSAWSIPSGVGTVAQDANIKFYGNSSLKAENTRVSSDLTFNNSNQEITITSDGDYSFSTFLQKNQADYVISGSVEIFKNGASLDTQSFSIGSATTANDINEEWQKFTSTNVYDLEIGDEITFSFKLDADAVTALTSVKIYIDGFNFYNLNRLQSAPPVFTPPNKLIGELKNEKGWAIYKDGLSTPTITIGTTYTQITIDSLGANTTSYLPLEIRGTGNLFVANKITPIKIGDDYDGRLDLKFESKSGTPKYLEIIIDFGGGVAGANVAFTGFIQMDGSTPYEQSMPIDFFSLATFKANGGTIYGRTNSGTVNVGKRDIKITRKSTNLG